MASELNENFALHLGFVLAFTVDALCRYTTLLAFTVVHVT